MNRDVTISLAAYPALRTALLFALGIWAGKAIHASLLLISMVILVLVVTLIACESLRSARAENYWFQQFLNFGYLLLVVSMGVLWMTVSDTRSKPTHHHFGKSEQSYILHGTISESTETSGGNIRIRMRVDSLEASTDVPIWREPFKIEGYYREESGRENLKFGNYITVSAELDNLDEPRNPHQFDYRSILKRQGIYLIASIDQIKDAHPVTSPTRLVYWQSGARQLIDRIFSEDHQALAKAVILGDRSGLDRDHQTAFSRAGLAHLMAVSGMHVGFLMAPIWFLIPFFWKYKHGSLVAFLMSGLILTGYAAITGFAISVLRASTMAALLMYARCFRKQSNGLNLLGAAGLILLIANPGFLFDVGFQLSFGAVLIILTTMPASRELLPIRWRYTWSAKVYQFVMVSILVQSGLFPILVHYFNEFSLIGPLSNTIAVPLVQIMFTISLFNMGLALIAPDFAVIINYPADGIIWLMDWWVGVITMHDFSWIESSLPGMWFFLLWTAAIAVFASLHKPELRWKCINVLLGIAVLVSAWNLWQNWQHRELTITAFDVGQADALLIEAPDGTTFFYDTGLKSRWHDSGRQVLEPELQAMDIDHIDAIIHSHPHADHIGGTRHLIENFTVDAIYQPDFDYDSQVYTDMMATAAENEIPVETVALGDVIELTPELRLFVLAPHNRLTGSDPNTFSAVVKLQYGETSVLLTGDATAQTEEFMIDDYGSFLDSDLLKVGHHGSSTSSTESFLDYVDPAKSVASLALNSRFGHPHYEAAHNLVESGTRLRYTSLQGAIRYVSCGKEIQYDPWD